MEGDFLFRSRSEVAGLMIRENLKGVLFVDSFDGATANMARFRPFNPFFFWPDRPLPVPGITARSGSIEAIWQGLKIVDGRTEAAMFSLPPWKRPSDGERRGSPSYRYRDSTFAYGDRQIDLIAARFLIYAVSYLYLLERVVPICLIDEIRDFSGKGGDVIFFDWDSNGDILAENESFSHSALLVAWFSGTLSEYLFAPAEKALSETDLSIFRTETAAHLTRYQSRPPGRSP